MISPVLAPRSSERGPTLSAAQLEVVLATGTLDLIRENQRFGLPLIIERDGQIVRQDPFEAEAELLRRFPALAELQPLHAGPIY